MRLPQPLAHIPRISPLSAQTALQETNDTSRGADTFERASARSSHILWRDQLRHSIDAMHKAPTPPRDIQMRVHDLARDHANAVKRSANHIAGLAIGTRVEIAEVQTNRTPAQAERLKRLSTGQSTLSQAMETLAGQIVESIDGFRNEVNAARMQKEHTERLTLVNFSWGYTPINGLLALLKGPLHPNAAENPLKHDVATHFAPRPLAKVKTKEILHLLTSSLRKTLATGDAKRAVTKAKTQLSASLRLAMKENVLFFSSAGNMGAIGQRFGAGDLSQNVVNDVEPLTVVGMANINTHDLFGDNEVNPLSSDGADFITNGQELPVGEDGSELTGTSFSTPLAMSAVHEMARINPSLSARALYQILQHPFVFDSLREKREGKGMLDIEAAVELARDWDEFGDH